MSTAMREMPEELKTRVAAICQSLRDATGRCGTESGGTAILLDLSGSMYGHLEGAKFVVEQIAASCDDGQKINIIGFSAVSCVLCVVCVCCVLCVGCCWVLGPGVGCCVLGQILLIM